MSTTWQVTSSADNGHGLHTLTMLRDGADIELLICVHRRNGRGHEMDECAVHVISVDVLEGDDFDGLAARKWVERNENTVGDLTGSADVAAEFPRKTKKVA